VAYPAIKQSFPTMTARQMAGELLRLADVESARKMELAMRTAQIEREKIQGVAEAATNYAKEQRRREDLRKQQRASRGLFGLGGAGAGTALGALLAVPTGGLSVAAGAALGGGIGGLAGGAVDYALDDDAAPMVRGLHQFAGGLTGSIETPDPKWGATLGQGQPGQEFMDWLAGTYDYM